MNLKKFAIILASLVCFAPATETVIWDGSLGGAVSSGGSWWWFGDHDSTSSSNFPELNADIAPWVEANAGIMDVTYTLMHSANGYAYYGIGFNFVDPEVDTPQTWEQICVEYSLTGTARVAFQLKNFHHVTHDNDYEVLLAKKDSITKTCFTPANFKQPGPNRTDSTVFPIDSLLQVMRGIKFVANGSAPVGTNLVSNLKLKSIYTIEGASSISPKGTPQSLRLTQKGNSISINGMGRGTVSIELVNLSGKVIAKNVFATEREWNISNIPRGIYMARFQNGTNTYTQRIAILP
jgi:hypothetical protein